MYTAICGVGGRFSRCHNRAVQTCQYCGRDFCPAHAHYMQGHEAVCTRKQCRAKHDDLRDHMAFLERANERNRHGLCAIEGCEGVPAHLACSLCKAYFCDSHISQRMYPTYDGFRSVDRLASVCPHCWPRRKIWRM